MNTLERYADVATSKTGIQWFESAFKVEANGVTFKSSFLLPFFQLFKEVGFNRSNRAETVSHFLPVKSD